MVIVGESIGDGCNVPIGLVQSRVSLLDINLLCIQGYSRYSVHVLVYSHNS